MDKRTPKQIVPDEELAQVYRMMYPANTGSGSIYRDAVNAAMLDAACREKLSGVPAHALALMGLTFGLDHQLTLRGVHYLRALYGATSDVDPHYTESTGKGGRDVS